MPDITDIVLCIQTRPDSLTTDALAAVVDTLQDLTLHKAALTFSHECHPDLPYPARVTLLGTGDGSAESAYSRYWFCAWCRHVFDHLPPLGDLKISELRCPLCRSKRLQRDYGVAYILAYGCSLAHALTWVASRIGLAPPPAKGPLPWGWRVPSYLELYGARPVIRVTLTESLHHLRSHLALAEQEGRKKEAAWLRRQETELVKQVKTAPGEPNNTCRTYAAHSNLYEK